MSFYALEEVGKIFAILESDKEFERRALSVVVPRFPGTAKGVNDRDPD